MDGCCSVILDLDSYGMTCVGCRLANVLIVVVPKQMLDLVEIWLQCAPQWGSSSLDREAFPRQEQACPPPPDPVVIAVPSVQPGPTLLGAHLACTASAQAA